ncbi:ABC transporter ATP-binding protein [Fimbriiglobus ruber]|uniref:ABC transporter ATP-binding protein n=1 Tax=Fimbriiglobus ruber TaxID=1908690 RepID=A0A225E2H3_9BACT|nr:ABC transporter ATP-binding protein [Fimbriiglobus ruber]OWK43689.1 ABC transporter ATP-binding protein [Fimbriiglobus ruber]
MSLLLELDSITREFGAFTALHGITLRLPPGRVGLLGPNGAGKSTLLKILMGLIPPSSGVGRVLDQPLGGDSDSAANWKLRRLIGFMPEADALVPGLTGIEYVSLAGQLYGMSRRQSQRRAHEVLSYLGLEEARYRNVEEYSAGMKQRAKLAQALVHDPPVLLLDEPTSGLDPAGRDTMLNLIRELGTDHGKSVILSTHLLADVQAVCQQVVIIAGGSVRGQGTVEELCARRADRFKLRVQGDTTRFRDDLLNEGVAVLAENGQGELRVTVPAGWSNLAFFKLADVNDVIIRALLRDDETLEELFLRTVNDGPIKQMVG